MSEEAEEFESGGLPPFVRDPLGMVRRRWRWMLGATALGVLGTLGLVLALEPLYEAEATVLVESQQIPADFVRPTVEEDSLQRIDAMVGRVLTHDRLKGLIEKHDLYPELHGVAPTAELVSAMREAIRIEPTLGFAGSPRDSARIFSVRFAASTGEVAAQVANEIAGLLPVESVRSRTKQAQLTTEFLRKELERAEIELREQNARIREFKESYRGELPAELQGNLGKLDRLQEQRQSLALQIAEASNRVATLAQAETSVAGASTRLDTLRAELARELSTKTERHPTVLALKQEIALVQAELAAAPAAPPSNPTAALVAVERGTLSELRSQLAETEANLRELDSQVGRTPARQEELTALEEKASVLRETYTEFLRKVQEAELAQNLETAQQGERVSVLNWAGVPTEPQRTRWKYLAAGLVAALGLGLGLGIVFETFDPVLVSTRQVESVSGLPVLGSIPRIA